MERILSGRQGQTNRRRLSFITRSEPTPEIVEAHLRADRNLTPETAAALSELFPRRRYTQFSEECGKTSKKRR